MYNSKLYKCQNLKFKITVKPGVCALGLCAWGGKGGNKYTKKELKTEISNSVGHFQI